MESKVSVPSKSVDWKTKVQKFDQESAKYVIK